LMKQDMSVTVSMLALCLRGPPTLHRLYASDQ
jgi:hypothetical protein